MKSKDILNAVGDIKEEYIEEASLKVKIRKRAIIGVSIAACFCLAVGGIGIALAGGDIFKPNGEAEIGEEYYEDIESTEETIDRIPYWYELNITSKFNEIKVNGKEYSARNKALPIEKKGEHIADVTLLGIDEITKDKYYNNASIYKINGTPDYVAVAVKYEGEEGYYPATCGLYRPETLGQFITDLDLKNNLSFSGEASTTIKKSKRKYSQVKFNNIETEKVWELLEKNTDKRSVENYDSFHFEREAISVGVNLELFGYPSICIWLTEDGYLHTNILSTGKAFYIGEDAVKEFKAYAVKNWKYKEIYSYTVDESFDDEGKSTASVVGNATPAYDPNNS